MTKRPNFKKNKVDCGNWRLLPIRGTIQIMGIYVVLGVAWIFLSDKALMLFFQDPRIIEDLQLAKGIFYVVMTAVLFYFIIKKRMVLYVEAIAKLQESNREIGISNERLRQYERQLYDLAYTDALTGLPNRNKLRAVINEHIAQGNNALLGIVYIDINDFKTINEVKGFDAGDLLITTMTRDLLNIAVAPHQVFRYSGDQFVILLRDLDTRQHMGQVVQRYTKEVRRSLAINEDEYFFSVSVGIATYPHDGKTYEDLLQRAEIALQVSKRQGRGVVVIYESSFAKQMADTIELTNMLHQALLNNEMMVYFQPICDVKKQNIYAFEALIRWKQEKLGFIPPLNFIDTAEKSGQIFDLTRFVIEKAFMFHQAIHDKCKRDVSISINLSSKLILTPEFIVMLRKLIANYKIKPTFFIFEITESLLIENIELAIERMVALQMLGFKIALDDFGTGYSSLTYLQRLPLDILKIDRSFIMSMDEQTTSYPFLTFMIELGHSLGLQIVAEGVETAYQKQKLIEFNIDLVQGYYHSKPIPIDEALSFVEAHPDC